MHYVHDERDRFVEATIEAEGVPESVPLDPGESIRVG
jgi:hypothetical protein